MIGATASTPSATCTAARVNMIRIERKNMMMTGLYNTQCLIVLLKCQISLTGNVLLGKLATTYNNIDFIYTLNVFV